MKKILVASLIILSSLSLAGRASAKDSSLVFAGYSAGEDNSYTYFGGATALNGDLDKDGALLRVGGGYGTYTYATPGADFGNNVKGAVTSGDLMLGYNHHFSKGIVTLYAGGNYDNYKLNRGDNNNRTTGGKPGGKVQFEAFLSPTKNTRFTNISSYTSIFNAYWTQTSVGYSFGNVVFGPEVSFLGNSVFNQQRFGARFSEIKLGAIDLYVSGGYMKSSGLTGDDGYYSAIGFASRF